ncbi:regulatory protein [uncultured phage cr130_1]|uniref:Regulatory protein n=1 Tax=uncultured phage cr130_1 TaxID=2772092 RepID=A0A7M1RTC5_9CAUD|nr:regulatory protein [uncultured phage cr130_1]QOR57643.1 regulatory protein [uncultured phage cr130_1]
MNKDTTKPTAFDSLLSSVYGDPAEGTSKTDMDIANEFENTVEDKMPADNPAEEINADDTDPSAKDDDSTIPQNTINNNQKETPVETTDNIAEPSDDDVREAEQVGLFFDAIGQSLGWNMDDIKEEDRPLTVEDLTDYIREVVDQNSVPQYADERVQQLDEYVKNGGKFEDFYGKQQTSLAYDNLDMDDETNQKNVISELLRYNGYTDEQIKNKIERYEDADMLEEESEDALSRLKTIKKQQIEYEQQQLLLYMQQQEEQLKAFYTQCMNQINNLQSIQGIQIPASDRAKLADYIFNVDQDGISKFQKDYNDQDKFINNLLTTAYITMKGDSLITTAKRDGESSATEKLRKILRHSSRNRSTYNTEEKPKSAVELASKFFS